MMTNPLAADLDHILAHTGDLWDDLRGRRIFMTGGTGFVGCWLLESLLWGNDKLNLDVTVEVLTRDAAAFHAKTPHLARHPAVTLHIGDVRDFAYPNGNFDYIIHAATTSAYIVNPLEMLDTIVDGTRRVLDLARQSGAKRLLFTSSGAVYGRQPPALSHVSEEYHGAPDSLNAGSAYAQGKRLAEFLCAAYHREFGVKAIIARGFAFVGPYLPEDAHFAVGNFLRDARRGGPVVVKGDGTAYRSYLYAADLAIWLWTILLRGTPGRAYNVGSEDAISMAELAQAVAASVQPALPVHIERQAAPGVAPHYYVPSTLRARRELGLQQTIDLPEALARSLRSAG